MRRTCRGVLLATLVAVPFALLAIACSSEDEDPARARRDAGPDTGKSPILDGGPVDSPAAADVPTTPPIDGGHAFDFAPPYAPQLGPSSRSDAGHNFATNTPPSNPYRTQCLTCHREGGTAATRPFFAAGTVQTTGDKSQIEVRLKAFISANAVSAYTDADGNWFIPTSQAAAANVVFSVRPGVRNATKLRTMGPSPAIGNCNQCHGGGPSL